MDENTMPREMTGAELASMLKSSINFKSLGGLKSPDLNLTQEDMDWWHDAKVGMFFHWGLYSILGRGEWVCFNEKIPKKEYEDLAREFNPENFEMQELTDLAKDFGARYMVMVTRHHDGFALWDSPGSYENFTSYKTGSKRDFVKEYTDACRASGLGVGVYYSPMDWRFPGYFDPEGLPENAALMKAQCYDQVEELCTKYGKIDIVWYDGSWLAHKGSDTSSSWFWEPVELNKMVRNHQPKAIINPRSGWEGNFYCDEGSHEITGKMIPVPWEKNMCVCSGSSWGWMENDPVSKFDWLIQMLVNVICRGGNFLLNVGPDRNGKLSDEVKNRMYEIGEWLKMYGEAVYGTRCGPFEPQDKVFGSVWKENKVYIHVQDLQKFKEITLPGLEQKILSVHLFSGNSIDFIQKEDGIKLLLPDNLPEAPDTIVCLMLDTPIVPGKRTEIYFTGKS